jgi:hypothetical protein
MRLVKTTKLWGFERPMNRSKSAKWRDNQQTATVAEE